MKFEVVAQEPDAFRSWAEQQAEDAAEPTSEGRPRPGRLRGPELLGCHTIRGVADEGEYGPDLTHLASREHIGAGIRP